MSCLLSQSKFVIASAAKQSMARLLRSSSDGLWIAASPAAPRNDEGVNR
jgi:hypothetical protein